MKAGSVWRGGDSHRPGLVIIPAQQTNRSPRTCGTRTRNPRTTAPTTYLYRMDRAPAVRYVPRQFDTSRQHHNSRLIACGLLHDAHCDAFIQGYELVGNREARLPHAQQTRTWPAPSALIWHVWGGFWPRISRALWQPTRCCVGGESHWNVGL